MIFQSATPAQAELSGRSSPIRYLVGRVLQMLPTLLLIILAAFALLHLAPGDAAQALAGESGGGDAVYLETLRHRFGLDQPLYVQFLHYGENILTGQLGFSFRNNMSVLALIGARLAPTLLLTGSALLLAVTFGLVGGALSAIYRGRLVDRVLSAIALVIYATPGFLLGVGLIILFAMYLPWFPAGGFADSYGNSNSVHYAISVARHLVLPATTLGALYGAVYMRFTRGAMLEIYDHDHVRTARSKGLSLYRITTRHVLRNALLPVVTVVGLQAGSLLGGAILVETVFSWPGLGRLAFEAVGQRDYNLLSGLVLCTGFLVVIINLVVDAVYALLDPRVTLR